MSVFNQVKTGLEEAWEAGRNHPEGAACRLLALAKADPQSA